MNLKIKKQYDALHAKIKAIYLGATGETVEDDKTYSLTLEQANNITNALWKMNKSTVDVDLANDFQCNFAIIDSDRELEDVDKVTDWLFEKGVRA